MHIRAFTGRNFIIFFGYILLSYPMFYYAYKFGFPDFGASDFYSYAILYKDWDFERIESPYNLKLISCFCIYLMNKVGFYYEAEIVYTTMYPHFDQQVFFNAVFFNYICLVLTCMVIYKLVLKITRNEVYAFAFGVLYLLGFGTIFFALKPTADSCAILLFGISFYYYLKKSYWVYLFLLLAVIQREYILIIYGVITVIDYLHDRKKYFLGIFISSCMLFVVYYVIRKTWLYTPRYEYAMTLESYMNAIINPNLEWVSFFKQTMLVNNLLFIYVAILVVKKTRQLSINRNYFFNVFFVLVQGLIMSVLTHFGNNAGRYFYFAVPMLLFYMAVEAKPLLSNYLKTTDV